MDDLVPLDRGYAGPVGYMFKSIYLVKRGPNDDLAPLFFYAFLSRDDNNPRRVN